MASPSCHPRRRAQKHAARSPDLASLRKSDTFSARTGLRSDLVSPHENSRFYPKRSPTSLDEVFFRDEDLIAARQERVAQFLEDVNTAIEGNSPDSGMNILNQQDVLAVPELMVNRVIVPNPLSLDDKKIPGVEHHHGSDSGLGSSVDTPREDSRTLASTRSSIRSSISSQSAITRSFSADSPLSQSSGPELSKDALKHIREKILEPILADKTLQEYHPLVSSIPKQVDGKYIANLRDLEKTLLYEAPRFSLSTNSFIKFWEFSIQCLHTTVDFLTERDQRRPSDRPYTNNYFLDLVEQIRRYADIMRRTREKEENGDELDEMDYSPDEEITIQGGISHNGRPAEIVRKKNGKTIPLSEESRLGDDAMSSVSAKRHMSDDESDDDDDDVYRSMARRRKSDKAGDVMHVCSTCRKEFKRPCDLTKHEKTHSRPFKCSEPSCRYHDLGWPTEKERDRHINDKHSSAPKMYHCRFPPCTYSSKRESNCKQHMEKAHGWNYIRSKSNGKNKVGGPSSSSNLTPSTPLTPLDATPISAFTPGSNFAPSPWFPTDNGMGFGEPSNADAMMNYGSMGARRDSTTTAGTNYTYSSGFSPEDFAKALENVRTTESLNFNSPLFSTTNNMDIDFGFDNTAFQQPTPALSNEVDFGLPDLTSGATVDPVHISPVGHGDVTLFSPEMALPDEGFGEGFDVGDLGNQDFLLFPSTSNAQNSTAATWFPEMNMGGMSNGHFDQLGFDATNIFPQ